MFRFEATLIAFSISCFSYASTTMKQLEELKNNNKKWSVAISSEIASNSQSKDTSDFSSYSQIIITPTYYYDENIAFKLSSGLVKEMSGKTDLLMTNTHFVIQKRKSLSLLKEVLSFPSLAVTLATNERDHTENTFLGSVSLNTNAIIPTTLFKKDSSVSYTINLKKNFHQYESNAFYNQNTSEVLSQSLTLSTDINRVINISLSGSYAMGWSYNRSFKSSYSHLQSLTWDLSNKNYLSLGHAVGGNALAYNGRDLDIKTFDPVNSQVFISYSKIY